MDPFEPCLCPLVAAFQPLVLPPRPAHQMAVDAPAEWDHRARVERGEVCEPTPQHEIDLGCEVVEGQVLAPMYPPG